MPTRAPKAGRGGSWITFAAALGFLAGMLVMAALGTIFPAGVAGVTQPLAKSSDGTVVVKTSKDEPSPVTPPPPASAPTAVSGANAVDELRNRNLTLPVEGLKANQLRDTFNEMRGASRRHEGLDVLAPRNTPVLAVEDGTIAKLFLSDAGGITIYQYDPSQTYVYYYAHLERYADGLKEGAPIKRGQVIGYVGTTGNAPADTPHLHFAIFQLTSEKKWWQGTPIDPYSVLK